ncbi:carbon starvation CstA family protein [uncultured Sphaerochaeta sp.]|uniref:carbon starvation CstA family protein n=1 Tax=uncultured Sphaerochaeta sp. TaxID=886478 RepID=UPI002A0A69E7|nr:carbon starvation CstA family protein [uncultured Sphaerochaeta sp.]
MNGIIVLLIGGIALLSGYFFYGKVLSKLFGVDPSRKTPAVELEDGVDYVPTNRQVVFGHHFASIAGAAPIVGPIVASMFGWVPVLLWCIVGGIFFGGVQDFGSMFASVRNKGRSIGYIIELYVGKAGKKLFLLFSWLFCILVIAAFGDIVAVSFNGIGANGVHQFINGATASTSVLFIFVSVAFGFYIKKKQPTSMTMTIIAILLLVACITLGMLFPSYIPRSAWLVIVFLYIMVASVTPVWALLQPRDFLNSFLLIFMIVAAMVGIFVAHPAMNLPAFAGWNVKGQNIFPFLFVTIACGAVSGFHALVASETSSKQVKSEKDMLPISYGGMLVESLLAVIALVCVGAKVGTVAAGDGAPVIFAKSVAAFLGVLGIPNELSSTIITLAVSAFALTSLDSVARVARLSFQEFFLDSDTDISKLSGWKKICVNKYFATILTLVLGYILAKIGYANIWPLFGSANQMLSALALCAVALFMQNTNRNGKIVWIPMFIMLAVTYTALTQIIIKNFATLGSGTFVFGTNGMQLIFGILILALGLDIGIRAVRKLFFNKDKTAATAV